MADIKVTTSKRPIPMPQTEALRIEQRVDGLHMSGLAGRVNHLRGYRFLNAINVSVEPFRGAVYDTTNVLDRGGNPQWSYIPFVPSPVTTHLFVVLGYAAAYMNTSKPGDYADSAYVDVEIRKGPTAAPGDGDIIDPGCRWSILSADIVSPVSSEGEYLPGEGRCAYSDNGFLDPGTVNPADAMGETPRLLVVDTLAGLHEIKVEWDFIKLTSISIIETVLNDEL